MTTDTALGVTKLVIQDKIPLNKIPFIVRILPSESSIKLGFTLLVASPA